MKIAIVYNRESQRVINLFGMPNREKYGLKAINRILDALKQGGHSAMAVEGDKDLIDRLEEFMPRVLKGERPGMVFNLSYGIQGQARYTHVPGMLEMVGIPYVGSGPLAHSLALDKVVAKMIFRQQGLPTPDFAVLADRESEIPELTYPMIVKPKNESVSFGIKVVNDDQELREAANVIFDQFNQAVLVEQYIKGREINVGLIGNGDPEAFPPVELLFGDGPQIYTLEDKKGKSGREIGHQVPAALDEATLEEAKRVAKGAFQALGCYDCARVDMRLDEEGRLYILEINSLPSLGEHGSYTIAAQAVGLDFPKLINRLVEVATARYFGTPVVASTTQTERDPDEQAFNFLTDRRDRMEKRLGEWVMHSSRTNDIVGIKAAHQKLDRTFTELGLRAVSSVTRDRAAWTWETPTGFDGGTLLVFHVDVGVREDLVGGGFRKDPENLMGEGIGVSRGPMVMAEFALRALRNARVLRKLPLGIVCYADEGLDAQYSREVLEEAFRRAGQVLVLRPGNAPDFAIHQRRGQRVYRLTAEGRARRQRKTAKQKDVLRWVCNKLEDLAQLTTPQNRVSVATTDLKTDSFPMLLPHRVTAHIQITYGEPARADGLEEKMRAVLGKDGFRWSLDVLSDRPPMPERGVSKHMIDAFTQIAERWELPFQTESSLWPSVSGLVNTETPVLCGLGPVCENIYTPQESISRISLLQRTVLLSLFLMRQGKA